MKIVFALVKSGSPPLGYGKIWAATYWNMGKVWMLLFAQIMAKSVCPSPQILYCQWWLLNSPKYVLSKDYVELLDFAKIWRIGKMGDANWGQQNLVAQ